MDNFIWKIRLQISKIESALTFLFLRVRRQFILIHSSPLKRPKMGSIEQLSENRWQPDCRHRYVLWLSATLHCGITCRITWNSPEMLFKKFWKKFLSWVLAVLHEVLHTLFVVFHTVIGGITRSSTNELYQHTLFHKLKFNWKIWYFFTSEFGKLLRFVYSILEVLRNTLG